MKYKSWKRMSIELSAAQNTNLIYCERIENLRERIEKLRQQNADLRDQLPKVVSLDTTGRLEASMMPTGVKPFGVIDAMAKTIDHEQRPAGSKYEAVRSKVSNHAPQRCVIEIDYEAAARYAPRPTAPRKGVVAMDANGDLCVKWEKPYRWRPVSKFDTYGQNR